MLFAKKTLPTPRPVPTGGPRQIDPSQFRYVSGGGTEAPKNGWDSATTQGIDPPAPKNGW